ncbi:MAG TPA: hypothetical protein VHL14_00100, partial [Steroidobacteraceae bacterium]|nr:hypothetical protein [Steroidobacteraceae bacterium]
MTNNHHQDSSPGIRVWHWIVYSVIYIREWLRDLFFMLSPCRFSALIVVIVGVLLNFVPQCQEGLRALAERNEVQWLVIAQWTSFFIAAALVAFNAWYWARHMLNVQTISSHMLTSRRDIMRKYVPRVLGTLGLLSITTALWQAAKAYGPDDSPEVTTAHHILNTAIGCAAILTVVFFLFVQWRRHIFGLDWNAPVKSFKDLSFTTWWLLGSSAGMAFVLFLSFWFTPLHVGAFLGAPSIVLLAAATWIPFGSFCVFLGLRYDVPALTLLFGSAVVFGLWNDNHQVHVITDPNSFAAQLPAPSSRRSMDDAAHAWLQARQPELTAARASQQKYPVFIIATAGGGIRAAYWTATLLAGLEDHFPGQFARHTFGISGVSGGSVGSAAFVGLLAEQQAGNLQYRQGNHPNCEGMLRPWACAMLSQDFLSPVTGSMLYTDLTQRFLPFPVTSFDRGRTLEESFERAWQVQGLPGDRMAQPFMDLWSNDSSYQLPLLFLNSTTVESGRRAIVSPVKIDAKNFRDAMDAVEIISKPMPLSTAAHLSARFTYVSPAGTVVDDKGNTVIHLVDGGYFENGGISTA